MAEFVRQAAQRASALLPLLGTINSRTLYALPRFVRRAVTPTKSGLLRSSVVEHLAHPIA